MSESEGAELQGKPEMSPEHTSENAAVESDESSPEAKSSEPPPAPAVEAAAPTQTATTPTTSPPKSATPATHARVIRLLADATDAEWVRRKIVVFRRLEPGDVRSEGSHTVEESPYLEARVLELALPKRIHAEMTTLDKRKREAHAVAGGYFRSYDPAGVLFASGGTALFGIWLDYLPRAFFFPAVVVMAIGVVVGLFTKRASKQGTAQAQARWAASEDRKSYDLLAKDISDAWLRAANTIRREDGFYTDLRVAEGSAEPVRIASIDPRPYTSEPPAFDPDDFLPSVATGDDRPVRYEQVHATGEVITKSIDGSQDFAETTTAV